ncbi:CRISPR-associated Cse2 family protein [Prauserella shujinwangii]|uniref:CRISPR-associated Cse2 family protein n=1 Tax=Prauserella shujinwangii TaxID=1453103 RepID=A0A2T0M2U9_9PSEU|nr:type I-E CRISPR-associated protein Cse2/CasB [Prauserella shujinwangii]PRX51081.1 CRISPR-associated Cse2 family protein [Prauserella shujinwangii]
MTAETTATETGRQRRLGVLGRALTGRIDRLQTAYLRDQPAAKASLAQLRRGLGKPAGSVPEIWALTVGAVPPELVWRDDEPSHAEQAAHAALTLYALHQQSLPVPAHVPGTSFGHAVGRLRDNESRSEEAVTRRFMAVATAESMDELLVHVRGLVTQLRAHRYGFDYARFADDLHDLLRPGGAQRVRLAWGRAFYRTTTDTTEQGAEQP